MPNHSYPIVFAMLLVLSCATLGVLSAAELGDPGFETLAGKTVGRETRRRRVEHSAGRTVCQRDRGQGRAGGCPWRQGGIEVAATCQSPPGGGASADSQTGCRHLRI